MSKRGPKRLVTQAVRLGEYGKTKWHIELECGHSVESPRKPKINEERLCCKTCELKTKATIAAKVGVPLDQVDIVNGTATIFLDAQQVKRLKST